MLISTVYNYLRPQRTGTWPSVRLLPHHKFEAYWTAPLDNEVDYKVYISQAKYNPIAFTRKRAESEALWEGGSLTSRALLKKDISSTTTCRNQHCDYGVWTRLKLSRTHSLLCRYDLIISLPTSAGKSICFQVGNLNELVLLIVRPFDSYRQYMETT